MGGWALEKWEVDKDCINQSQTPVRYGRRRKVLPCVREVYITMDLLWANDTREQNILSDINTFSEEGRHATLQCDESKIKPREPCWNLAFPIW